MTQTTPQRQNIIQETLVRDNDQILSENLSRVEKYLFLTEDGEVKIQVKNDNLSGAEEVILHSLGVWFAYEGGLRDEKLFDTEEVFKNTTLASNDAASARISDLKKEGVIVSPSRGEYRLKDSMVGTALDKVEKSVEDDSECL